VDVLLNIVAHTQTQITGLYVDRYFTNVDVELFQQHIAVEYGFAVNEADIRALHFDAIPSNPPLHVEDMAELAMSRKSH
jgi:hypothetical protein